MRLRRSGKSLSFSKKKGMVSGASFLYTTALDWVKKHVPAEVAKHLVDFSLGRDVFEQGKWVSFVKLGNEWGISKLSLFACFQQC